MREHTKGPWKVDQIDYDTIVVEAGEGEVCSIHGYDSAMDEVGANVDLIVAAPDLLEALSRLIDEVYADEFTSETMRNVSTAIAKARGQYDVQ